jgi:hypothetical protein
MNNSVFGKTMEIKLQKEGANFGVVIWRGPAKPAKPNYARCKIFDDDLAAL